MLAWTHPAAARGQAHHEHGRQRPHRRVEQRIVGVQVAADEVGPCAATAVTEHRHHLPRQRVEQREDRHALGAAPRRPSCSGRRRAARSRRPRRPSGAHRRRPRPSTTRGRRCGTGSTARRPGAARRPGPAGVDSNSNGSVSSERKKIAPSRRSCSSADRSSRRCANPVPPAVSMLFTATGLVPLSASRCLGHGHPVRSLGYSSDRPTDQGRMHDWSEPRSQAIDVRKGSDT